MLGSYLFRTFGDTNVEIMSRVTPELLIGLFGGLFGKLTPLESWLLALYVHPLLLTLLSIVVVAICSRSLVAEIDRGTIDLLLSCPVARWKLVLATLVVVQVALVLLVLTVLTAMRLGLVLAGVALPESWPLFSWVTVNLWALFSAISGVVLLFSATASVQGTAVARSIAFLVVSSSSICSPACGRRSRRSSWSRSSTICGLNR